MSEQDISDVAPLPEDATIPDAAPQESVSAPSSEVLPEDTPCAESVLGDGVPAETAADTQASAPPRADVPETVSDAGGDAGAVTQAIGELKDTLAAMAGEVRTGGEAAAKLDARLTGMEGRIERLAADFAARLRFDAVKDEVISKQGKELDGFRRGAVAKELGAIIDNLILEIDGTRRIAKRLAVQEPTEANYKKAVEALLDGADALEDSVLSRAAVKRFDTPEGKTFDNVRHVLAKDGHEDTEDATKVGLIARSVRCGYERMAAGPDGQIRTIIVRPEQVAVWRLVEAPPSMPIRDMSAEPPASDSVDPSEPSVGQSI